MLVERLCSLVVCIARRFSHFGAPASRHERREQQQPEDDPGTEEPVADGGVVVREQYRVVTLRHEQALQQVVEVEQRDVVAVYGGAPVRVEGVPDHERGEARRVDLDPRFLRVEPAERRGAARRPAARRRETEPAEFDDGPT
jgi:hypothetical protein